MEDIDDDFGDLYADVEFQANSTINGISNDDFNAEKVNSAELIQDDEAKTQLDDCEREVDVDNGSDSEEDLNIVLNDDDDDGGGELGISVLRGVNSRSGGFEEDEEEDGGFEVIAEGDGLVKSRNSGGQSSDGLEVSPNGCRGEVKGNGIKCSYQSQHLQYKYTRHHGASFPTNSKANGFMRFGSCSSTSVRGDLDDNKYSLRMDSSSLSAQSGHNFSLPHYRTILDVNISAFEKKSWRHPGADRSDFFNFGFDEESWKLYCNRVEQLRQHTSLLTRTPTYGYSKAKEVYGAEAEYEPGACKDEPENFAHHRGAVSAVSRCTYREGKQFEMPKGRVIQVEDSILERRPSMDVRRVVDRDPDVVIQIAVQDCVEDSSGSGKEESTHKGSVHEASENGDFGVDDGIRHFAGGSGDELLLEGDVKRSGRPYPKRCSQLSTPSNPGLVDIHKNASGQISDVDGRPDQKVTCSSSEGQAEEMETSINTNEKAYSETCNAALSLGETDSLLGDHSQQEASSSISGSHVEASGNFASANPERLHKAGRAWGSNDSVDKERVSLGHLRKQSPKESLTCDYYQSINSKIHKGKTKTRDGEYNSRNRVPFIKDRRHYIRRPHNDSELRRHNGYEESCPFPYTDDAYYKRLQGFDSYEGEGFPYYPESELPSSYLGKRFSYNEVHAAYSRRPPRNHLVSGDETDHYRSRRWEERQYSLERRGSRLNDEVVGRDRYHYESGNSLNPPFCKETRLGSNYSVQLDKERVIRWRGKGDEFYSRKRRKEDDYMLEDNYENDFMREKYGYCGKEGKDVRGECGRHWPSTRRGAKVSTSHFGREPLNTNRGREFETISPRNVYDLRVTERHGIHTRRQSKERSRGSDCFRNNNDAGDSEGRVYYPDGQVNYERRRHWQHDSYRFIEDEYVYGYEDDEFLAEESSFSFERTIRSKMIGGKQRLMDNVEIEQHGIKLLREESNNNLFKRSSTITGRGNHGKPLLRCRDSVDLRLVGGEGKDCPELSPPPTVDLNHCSARHIPRRPTKSAGRCFNAGSVKCNDKHENAGLMVRADYSEFRAEEGETGNPKADINQKEEKWLDKFPITEKNEVLDIEEGQIVTEEVNENPPCENFVSEAEIRDGKKKGVRLVENATEENTVGRDGQKKGARLVENATEENTVGKGFNNPRILAVMAKMEKRRERFKEPIALKKENNLTAPKPEVDLIVEIMEETKQLRPARKRRWGGS